MGETADLEIGNYNFPETAARVAGKKLKNGGPQSGF